MKNLNTSNNFGQPQKVDSPTLAPAIVEEVAFMLMGDRPHTDIRRGQTLYPSPRTTRTDPAFSTASETGS